MKKVAAKKAHKKKSHHYHHPTSAVNALPKTGAGEVDGLLVPLGLGFVVAGALLRRGFRETP